jgi:hypothetical protein
LEHFQEKVMRRKKGPKPLVTVFVTVPVHAKPGDELKVVVFRRRVNETVAPEYDVTAEVEIQRTLGGIGGGTVNAHPVSVEA